MFQKIFNFLLLFIYLVNKKISKRHATSSFDVHEGRTVFMRNLSFDVTEKELENELKKFGTLKYCKAGDKFNLAKCNVQ